MSGLVTGDALSRQVIKLILLLYFGLSMLLTVLQMGAEYHREKQFLTQEIGQLIETSQSSIAQALWGFDEEQIVASIEGIYRNRQLFGVSVVGMDGEHWGMGFYQDDNNRYLWHEPTVDESKKNIESHPLSNFFGQSVPIAYMDNGERKAIGRVDVVLNSKTVLDRTWHTFIHLVIGAIFKTLGLWLVSIYVIQKLISGPVDHLRHSMDNFELDSTDQSVVGEKPVIDNPNGIQSLENTLLDLKSAVIDRNMRLEEYSQSMEQKVEARTQALNQSLKELKKASQVKSDFLAAMSHEIRTPMNAILGSIQLLGKTDLDEHQQSILDNIQFGGRTLMSIIDDILDLSKIEANKLELESIPFDLAEVLTRITGIFQPTALDKGLDLSFTNNGDEETVFVEGDPTRLTQVISNLVSNSVKFTERGGVMVNLSWDKCDDEACKIVIQVKDTGIGMTLEQQEGLFSAFTQADSSTTRNFGGTGLGLAISKQLVEAMNGDISVVSSPGLGSAFSITLQLKRASGAHIGDQHQTMDPMASGAANEASILLVEDVPLNREIGSMILEDHGHQVHCEENGQLALNYYKAHHSSIDVVLMDCLMPVMDGYEATQSIRQWEHSSGLPAVPIIALTANALNDAKQQCLEAGMDDFVSKPFDEDQLVEKIQYYLRIRAHRMHATSDDSTGDRHAS